MLEKSTGSNIEVHVYLVEAPNNYQSELKGNIIIKFSLEIVNNVELKKLEGILSQLNKQQLIALVLKMVPYSTVNMKVSPNIRDCLQA